MSFKVLSLTALSLPLVVGLSACTPSTTTDPEPDATEEPSWPAPEHGELATAYTGPDDVEAGLKDALAAGELEPIGYGRFVTSAGCALCHSNSAQATAMRDSNGAEIAPFNLWQGTMMANAARDPFWRAMVSAEKARTPSAAEAIETKCIRCHAPMASVTADDNDMAPSMNWANEAGTGEGQVFLDGVACTVCHQVTPGNLGREDSFSGGFVLGTNRRIYGPHQAPVPGPMMNHVNYQPSYGPHVLKPELCATCHTLVTHALDDNGEPIEDAAYVEQSPFLEWTVSAFYAEGDEEGQITCQDCHMPTIDDNGQVIETRIARSPPGGDFLINERQPFGRHLFVGANTVMPSIIKRERATLNPQATDEAFDAVVDLARQRLSQDTAEIAILEPVAEDGHLTFGVQLSSLVGHKLPTGFPSRRVFLNVRVLDADGNVLFESGATDERGQLMAGGEVLDIEKAGGPIAPHHDVITRPDEVAVFEQVMADQHGEPTFSLMRAVAPFKDNRLLPEGASAVMAGFDRIAPVGVDDEDFVGGGDVVHFDVMPGAAPARIEAELFYQGLSPRFMRETFQVPTPQVRAFRGMLDDADLKPESVATAGVDL